MDDQRQGHGWLIALVVVVMLGVTAFVLVPSVNGVMMQITAQRQAEAQISQARTDLQLGVERERTERSRLDSSERMHGADLRAEQYAADRPLIALVVVAGLGLVASIGVVVLMDWRARRQAAYRVMLLREAARLQMGPGQVVLALGAESRSLIEADGI